MPTGIDTICGEQSYSFDPTNIEDPKNPGVQNITKSKESSWKFPNIRKLVTGALAIQAAAMAPRAEAGPVTYLACVTLCCGTFPPLIPVLLPSCAAGCAPALALPTP